MGREGEVDGVMRSLHYSGGERARRPETSENLKRRRMSEKQATRMRSVEVRLHVGRKPERREGGRVRVIAYKIKKLKINESASLL